MEMQRNIRSLSSNCLLISKIDARVDISRGSLLLIGFVLIIIRHDVDDCARDLEWHLRSFDSNGSHNSDRGPDYCGTAR